MPILFIYLESYWSISASISFVDFLSQQQKDQTSPFHQERTDDRDIEQCCAEVPPSLTTRAVSQKLGSFQSPQAHPSELPAKLLFSFLHPFLFFSLSLLNHSSHCICKSITFTSAFFFFFYLCRYLNFFQLRRHICLSHFLVDFLFTILLFLLPAKLYSCTQIAQACTGSHLEGVQNGSFLPRQLNIQVESYCVCMNS